MAIFKAFKAVRYDAAKAGATMGNLICPPYDVIDAKMQDELYGKNEYNVVRVEFGKQNADDKAGSDRYSRAAKTFAEWLKAGVLKPEKKESFYIYEQTFDIASGGASRSKVVTRRGLLGAIKLEPFGTGCVHPHEETFGAPKADRLALMKACEANFSPVFGLVPDEDEAMTKLLAKGVTLKKADVEFKQDNGIVEKLWVIDDETWCAQMSEQLKPRHVFIADGHHRYETACNYRDERRKAENDPTGAQGADYNYGLMMLVPMSDPGLYILPTHRLIQTAPGLSKQGFLAESAALFEARDATEQELLNVAEEEEGPAKFGVIFNGGSRKILTARPQVADAMAKAAPKKSEAWRGLDVSVLQELVLKGMLRLSEEKVLRKEGISYTPDARAALQRVTDSSGAYVMGFILRPTLIEQVSAVAGAGEKMPQKSTFFYPKLLTGLAIRKL
ncbi:MAG TPA: DUF1015 domain-containing protein [Planctomycetota bacterium]|jgi:uncharacterized protein (DUF1015 family)